MNPSRGAGVSFFFKQAGAALSSPATHLPAGREDTSHFQKNALRHFPSRYSLSDPAGFGSTARS